MRNSRKNVPRNCSGGAPVRISDGRGAFHKRPCSRSFGETPQSIRAKAVRNGCVRDIKELCWEDSQPRVSMPADEIFPNVSTGTKWPRGYLKRLKEEYEPNVFLDDDVNEKAEFVKRRMSERLTNSEFWMIVNFAELNSNYSALARLYGVSQPTAKRWINLIIKKIIS